MQAQPRRCTHGARQFVARSLVLLVLDGALAVVKAEGPQASVAFEVASIRPNVTGNPQMVIRTPPGGGINARNVTPKFLIRYAFNIDELLIVEAPEWTTSQHFDIVATGPAGASTELTRGMLQAMLTERFKLRSHPEVRNMAVYRLVIADADRRLGEDLRPEAPACIERDAMTSRPSPPKQLPSAAEPMSCGMRAAFGHLSAGGVTMKELGDVLLRMVRRPVLDQTGLPGRFDLVVNYTPDVVLLQTRDRDPLAAPDASAPS